LEDFGGEALSHCQLKKTLPELNMLEFNAKRCKKAVDDFL